jgi:putative FmdB family regulatory protein
MPTYEYACLSCGTHVEVFQHFSEEPLTVCGICGGQLRKVFHPAGILFKGSGFYATDSRSSRSKASRDGSSDTAPTGEKTESGEKKTTGSDVGSNSETSTKKQRDPETSGTKEKSA